MSYQDIQPLNTNLLQATKFLLTFSRIGTVNYFCQTANIPGMSITHGTRSSPVMDIPFAGNKMLYNEFNIEFLLDEDLLTWTTIYNWLRLIADENTINRNALSAQVQTGTTTKDKSHVYDTAMLSMLDNLNNPTLHVKFHNIFPINLSDIQLDTRNSVENVMTINASFRYTYFEFITV